MNFAASSDLGGLGAAEGPPVAFATLPGNLVPRLLPWLGLLALLLLKPNRVGAAWWIWLPLAALVGASDWLLSRVGLSSQTADAFAQIVTSLGFGLAAVWLLSPFLRRSHRFFTCLTTLLALAGGGLFSLVTNDGLGGDFPEALSYLIASAVLSALLTVALTMAGYHCRRGYHAAAFTGWVMGWLLLGCSLAAAPFLALAWASSSGSIPVAQLLVPIVTAAAICLGVFLPFLALSTANPFFRSRLKALLHAPEAS